VDQAGAAHLQQVLDSTHSLVGSEEGTVPTLLRAMLAEAAEKMAGLFDAD
jgi:hypothetical protein